MKIEERINLMVEVSKEDWANKVIFKIIPESMKTVKKAISKDNYKWAVMEIDQMIPWLETLRDIYQQRSDDQLKR